MRRRRCRLHLQSKGGRGGTPFRRRPLTGSWSRLGTQEGGGEEGGRRLRDKGRGKGRRVEGGGKRRTHPDHLPCDDKVRASAPEREATIAHAQPRERGPKGRGACATGASSRRLPKVLFAHNRPAALVIMATTVPGCWSAPPGLDPLVSLGAADKSSGFGPRRFFVLPRSPI